MLKCLRYDLKAGKYVGVTLKLCPIICITDSVSNSLNDCKRKERCWLFKSWGPEEGESVRKIDGVELLIRFGIIMLY